MATRATSTARTELGGARAWYLANSGTPPSDLGKRTVRRWWRWRNRRAGWRVTKLQRVAYCGRIPYSLGVGVHETSHDGEDPRATTTGLVSCGSVWACAVCSAHIRQVRANEIADTAGAHLARGGGLVLVTLTVRHHAGERLQQLLDGLMGAWRRTRRGAPWNRQRDRHGIVGYVRATEITHGDHGWHPHLHVLLFTDEPLDDEAAVTLRYWLAERWVTMVEREGLRAPSPVHGTDLQVVRDDRGVGGYIAKLQEQRLGLEMARGDLKRGRVSDSLTPFELLDRAGDGDARAVRLWHEYEATTHGRRCIEWSRGLRDELDLGDEPTDDEIVAEDGTDEDTLLTVVDARDWMLVCRYGLDHDVLVAAELHGADGVHAVVRRARDLHRASLGEP